MATLWRLSVLCGARGGGGEGSGQPEVLRAVSCRGKDAVRIRLLGDEISGAGDPFSFGCSGSCRNYSKDQLWTQVFT